MFWLNFGQWDSSHGSVLTQERLYLRGKWTPLVKVRFRYLKTIRDMHRQASLCSAPPEKL